MHNFCEKILHRFLLIYLTREFAHFKFFLNTNLVLENFIIFHALLILAHFCLITWYWNKYLKFCKFAIFADYLSRGQGLSKNVSNVIDLYQIKEIWGVPWPPPTILGKPDVSLNRGNTIFKNILHFVHNGGVYLPEYYFLEYLPFCPQWRGLFTWILFSRISNILSTMAGFIYLNTIFYNIHNGWVYLPEYYFLEYPPFCPQWRGSFTWILFSRISAILSTMAGFIYLNTIF